MTRNVALIINGNEWQKPYLIIQSFFRMRVHFWCFSCRNSHKLSWIKLSIEYFSNQQYWFIVRVYGWVSGQETLHVFIDVCVSGISKRTCKKSSDSCDIRHAAIFVSLIKSITIKRLFEFRKEKFNIPGQKCDLPADIQHVVSWIRSMLCSVEIIIKWWRRVTRPNWFFFLLLWKSVESFGAETEKKALCFFVSILTHYFESSGGHDELTFIKLNVLLRK